MLLLLLLKLLLVLLLLVSMHSGVPPDSATPSVCARSLHLHFTSRETLPATAAFKRPLLQDRSDIHEDGAAAATCPTALSDARVFAGSAGGLGVRIR